MSDFNVEIEREEDGRWIGEVTELPGALTYGVTREEAVARTKALAFGFWQTPCRARGGHSEIRDVFAVAGRIGPHQRPVAFSRRFFVSWRMFSPCTQV